MKACDLFYDGFDLEPVPENFEDRNLGVVRPEEMNGNLWHLRPVADLSGEGMTHDAFAQVEVEPLGEVLDEIPEFADS